MQNIVPGSARHHESAQAPHPPVRMPVYAAPRASNNAQQRPPTGHLRSAAPKRGAAGARSQHPHQRHPRGGARNHHNSGNNGGRGAGEMAALAHLRSQRDRLRDDFAALSQRRLTAQHNRAVLLTDVDQLRVKNFCNAAAVRRLDALLLRRRYELNARRAAVRAAARREQAVDAEIELLRMQITDAQSVSQPRGCAGTETATAAADAMIQTGSGTGGGCTAVTRAGVGTTTTADEGIEAEEEGRKHGGHGAQASVFGVSGLLRAVGLRD